MWNGILGLNYFSEEKRDRFMKKLLLLAFLLGQVSRAETWKVEGKTFTERADVVRYVLTHNPKAVITQTRETTLTPKLTFKAIKKAKKGES